MSSSTMERSSSSVFVSHSMSDDPKHWKAELGLMNIRNTTVALSLEDMISWLKTLGIEVDSNFTQLKLLPRYAALGKMTAVDPSPLSVSVQDARLRSTSNISNVPVASISASKAHDDSFTESSASSSSSSNHIKTAQIEHDERGPLMKSPIEGFVPTRRVRQPMGGGSANIQAIFGGDDDTSQKAPWPIARPYDHTASTVKHHDSSPHGHSLLANNSLATTSGMMQSPIEGFVPTRKVREPQGGISTMSSILGGL